MFNFITQKHLDRRTLLKASGASIALPFLSAMLPAQAKSTKQPPKRFMAICSGLGFHAPHFIPDQNGFNYTASKYLKVLENHRKNFTVFSGLSHPNQNGANGHSSSLTWLTSAQRPGLAGFKNSISLDQMMAKDIGHLTRFPYLNLTTNYGSLAWTANGVSIPSESNVLTLYKKLFINGKKDEIDEEIKQIERGKSILDTVMLPAQKLNKSLGNADKQKFAEYLSSIRDLEKRLIQNADWAKKAKPKVNISVKNNPDKADTVNKQKIIYDLTHLALQTDSTRIVTFFISGMNAVPSNINGVSTDWHNLSHHGKDPAKIAELSLIEMAKMKNLNNFLDKLKISQETNGSLLDNTTLLFGSNLGNASSHSWRNLPVIVAGGGYKHGSHIAHDLKQNTEFANLFVQIGQRMGLKIDKFGSSTSTSIKGFN